MAKEQYTLRIEKGLLDKLRVIADSEYRSLNNQIEFLLKLGIENWENSHYSITKADIDMLSNNED